MAILVVHSTSMVSQRRFSACVTLTAYNVSCIQIWLKIFVAVTLYVIAIQLWSFIAAMMHGYKPVRLLMYGYMFM